MRMQINNNISRTYMAKYMINGHKLQCSTVRVLTFYNA